MNNLTKKQKKDLTRIIIASVLFVVLMILVHAHIIPDSFSESLWMIPVWLVPYFIVGYDVVRKCILGISHGQMFDESFLMTLATIGAFGCREFDEAVAVMLFYQVGEFFQSYAVGKSRGAISDLMSIAPDFANRECDDGSVETIDPDEIEPGDILVIKPGEKIPTDGKVIEGEGLINTSALTGESVPRAVRAGDDVISGCINGENLIRIQASKAYDDCTVAQILELVESAASKKSKTENFITRFAKYYTPAVVIGALLLAFIPPLVSGYFAAEFGKWVLRACTFLVISCPCALVISVPLAFFGGIGAASKEGVLVKGSNYLEMMAKLDTIVTDKTGTLTEGRFKVSMVEAASGVTTDDVIRYAAAVEAGSTHPIGAAIVSACDKPIPSSKVKDEQNYAGRGITAKVGRDTIAVGNAALFEELGIEIHEELHEDVAAASGTHCYVAKNGKYIGTILVADMPKAEAAQAIKDILAEKVRRIVMLTGDSESAASAVAKELGIKDYMAGLLPLDKVKAVEDMLAEIAAGSAPEGKLAFIGDGINDAPVLSRADVGIAMGSLGSDAAIEAADVVIMDDRLARIPAVIRIARKTIGISKANIVFALFVKFACLVLGALGIANMWVAVFADVGVAVICILNSMRMITHR
ncbi:MAG: heavy metal translocating P-type ATPase [Mogibacterium sp.]|nr:heavy metal translocating P-type ATPase [Mogibacterium sp.]